MAWTDRLQSPAYTSPSGQRFEFLYEDVSMEVDKKTTVFTFPEKDGAFIQDLGRAGRRFPFTIFFSGADYDQIADSFSLALEERGAGKLEHPIYGDRVVVPSGSFSREDRITTGGNQAVFKVEFLETIEDLTFPVSTESQASVLSDSADSFQDTTAEKFASDIEIDNASEAVELQNTASASVPFISEFEEITEQASEINSSFKTVFASYEENVRNVILEARDTALQAILLTRIPSRVETAIRNEIEMYENQIGSLITAARQPDGTNNPRNAYLYDNLLVSASLVALCEASLYSVIQTRPEAINAADTLLSLYDSIKTWQDDNIVSLSIIDSGESYCDMTAVLSQAVAYLINVSFDLPQERIVVLQNDRQMIEFIASVGLNVENTMDDFIQWNDLTSDDIEVLEAGSSVVYYA